MRGKDGNITLKIDLEKAFNMIEWSYIKDTLEFFNFPKKLIKFILYYISPSNIQVLINGKKMKFFTPLEGLDKETLCPLTSLSCAWKGFPIPFNNLCKLRTKTLSRFAAEGLDCPIFSLLMT